ncbi:putative tail fiber protein [Enterobacter phage Tyrion]|uniref:putative tail fiber protein n=1 Tax=Enterobacter phage Tyrion TaxID=1864623 RepID=UPI0007FB6C15|nr:putative tail fiber protein [Enterobacter phage Tyrion]ANN86194.1 putative tail fiber protein [Enterobacter phage Tyrion]
MTVSTEVDHNDYTGNGVTTTFPYTFRIFQKSDLVVQVVDLDENISVLVLDTDYTVTGAGGYTGGNVILATALASGYQISISRELPVTQETDLRNQGKFFAEVHEDAFDKLTMLIQQVRSMFSLALRKPTFVANYYDAMNNYIRNLRDPVRQQDAATKGYVDSLSGTNLNRTLRVPEAVISVLPDIEDRRNKALSFDYAGEPLLLDPSGSGLWGYVLIDSFQLGATISTRYQALRWTLPDGDGEYYRWDGALPKIVPPGSTPDTAGGVGPGKWVGVGDASLRGQLNNTFDDVTSLRNSENLIPDIPVLLVNYYSGVVGGGGAFYVDDADTTSTDNSGTVFVNASGQRIKRVLDGVCRWSDFGILPGMPVAPTKSQCEAVWAWGFANGCTRYETFQKGEMTFTFPLLFQVPADWTGGAVSFIAEGLHKFAYDFRNGATDDVVEIILKLEDLSGNTPIHTIYNFDNVGMGRFPGKSIRYTALRHTNAKNSMIKVTGKNNYGYALFIGGSDNSIVYNSTFYNCDGQLLVTSPGGAYDNFGDAIYVGAKNVSIQSPVIETTQGGRAGIVFEGTSVDRVGGEVTNCFIKGYDRGIHIETIGYRMDAVNITGGRIQDCNTSILAFNGVAADMGSDMSVIVKGLTSRLDSTISGHANPTGFTLGHFMASGINMQITTEGCSWQAQLNNITIVGGGKWISSGDRMFVNSGGIAAPYARSIEINNMYAPANRNTLSSSGNVIFTNSFWGGDIAVTGGNKSVIDNIEMTRLTFPNCGRISLVGSNSAIVRNIIFQFPDTWAIDNTQTLQVPVCPIIENIHVNSTPTGTATLQRNAENTGASANRYRRAMPSYISNGTTFTTIP